MEDRRDFRSEPAPDVVTSFELGSDQSGESVGVYRMTRLGGVEFWSVSESERPWEMLHDKYSACLVAGRAEVPARLWHSRGAERTAWGGSLELVEPGEVSRTVEVFGRASFFVVWWEPSVIERVAADLGVSGLLHFKLPQIDLPALSERFALLCDRVTAGADAAAIREAYDRALRELLLVAGEGATSRRARGRHHPAVRQAIDYMTQCYGEPISLDRLAAEARLSKFHFARCFQSATGVAPHKYLTLLRVREARRLLETGMTVGEAADRTGFADASHLSRTFRKWLGVAPGAWGKAWVLSTPTEPYPATIPPPNLLEDLERDAS